MYEELIKALRGCVLSKPCDACPYYDPNGPTKECTTMNIAAADAIEKLSMRIHGDEAAIAGMKREIERMVVADKPRWIPVTERLPDFEGMCLCMRKSYSKANFRHQEIMYFDYDEQAFCSNVDGIFVADGNVTHWMPLPEPPKEE